MDWISFCNDVRLSIIQTLGQSTQNEEVTIGSSWASVVTQIPVGRFNSHPTFSDGAKQNFGDFEINPDNVVAVGKTVLFPITHVITPVGSFHRFRDGDNDRQFCFT